MGEPRFVFVFELKQMNKVNIVMIQETGGLRQGYLLGFVYWNFPSQGFVFTELFVQHPAFYGIPGHQGQFFSVRGETVPHCSGHGESLLPDDSVAGLQEEKRLLAWGSCWCGLLHSQNQQPRTAGYQGCSSVGWYWLQGLPWIRFRMEGHYAFAYNFPVPAVTGTFQLHY